MNEEELRERREREHIREQQVRSRINTNAGEAGKLVQAALGIEWYDCETSARRVAEYCVSQQHHDELVYKLKGH